MDEKRPTIRVTPEEFGEIQDASRYEEPEFSRRVAVVLGPERTEYVRSNLPMPTRVEVVRE